MLPGCDFQLAVCWGVLVAAVYCYTAGTDDSGAQCVPGPCLQPVITFPPGTLEPGVEYEFVPEAENEFGTGPPGPPSAPFVVPIDKTCVAVTVLLWPSPLVCTLVVKGWWLPIYI